MCCKASVSVGWSSVDKEANTNILNNKPKKKKYNGTKIKKTAKNKKAVQQKWYH